MINTCRTINFKDKTNMKTTPTNRQLTARFFPCAGLSRIYVNGKWVYSTDENLSGCSEGEIQYFLANGDYWKK